MRAALVTYGGFALEHPDAGGALRDAGLELRVHPRASDRNADELAALCAGVVAAIADADPFDASVFARCPDLRIIARTGVGLDSIDLDAATASGVAVTITPGMNNETVADHALALMLAALRGIVAHDARVRAGGWRDFGSTTSQLHGSTVGIIGYGAIGRAVARRVRAFDAEVLAYDPLVADADADAGVSLVELDELLSRSDVVSVHAPLSSATHHLLDAARIARLKRGAVVVNTARGPLIDEAALLAAVSEGHVRAAGLDVFEIEPPAGQPVTSTPGITLSPHIAGISTASNLAMSRAASAAVLAVLAGEPVENCVNPPALERR
jgi:phosphoglycerate dehydrogenase-like enzyme